MCKEKVITNKRKIHYNNCTRECGSILTNALTNACMAKIDMKKEYKNNSHLQIEESSFYSFPPVENEPRHDQIKPRHNDRDIEIITECICFIEMQACFVKTSA